MKRIVACLLTAMMGCSLVVGCAEEGPGVAKAPPGETTQAAPSKVKGNVEGPLTPKKIGE